MHEEVLPAGTRDVFQRLAKSGIVNNAYLAGGTNIALQLGHRISRDLDFFTPTKFDERALAQQLEAQGLKTDRIEWQTIDGYFGDVKFSWFFYTYPLLFETVTYDGIHLVDLRDAAAMKVEAIAARGTRRDFVDLFVLLQQKGWRMVELFSWYQQKYGGTRNTMLHALKSLAYFDDADTDETPLVLLQPVDWQEVKRYFRAAVDEYTREALWN